MARPVPSHCRSTQETSSCDLSAHDAFPHPSNGGSPSRQGPFSRDSGAPWKSRRRWPRLTEDSETRRALGELRRKALRNVSDAAAISARPNPQNGRAARTDERQTPLRSNRRGCKSLRDRGTVAVRRLFLRAPLDDAGVRRRETTEEFALASVCFEQRELAVRQRMREWNSRNAAAGSDVYDRTVVTRNELDAAKRIVNEHPTRFDKIADRC